MSIGIIYEAADLRRIADLMDAASKEEVKLRIEGEAFVIDRCEVTGIDGIKRWDTTVEFFRAKDSRGWPDTDE